MSEHKVKIIFWTATIIDLIAEGFLLQGFINIYYKNYNGGPESSSGSIKYPLMIGLVIILSGAICYFTGRLKLATWIVGIPIALILLYMLVLILPILFGGRIN
jgi:UDP-N-acetylmuramyl pentapeptide phosphotransferase/UDP-N-acetylglucosamine-1-phosphate transferase